MDNLWNSKDLLPPPTNTAKVKVLRKDVILLHTHLIDFLQAFENTKCINEEAAMLSRTIYRMKYKFRSDKGFKSMEKVNRALLQYLNMNYVKDLNIFLNTIDTDTDNSIRNIDIYLPTQQMLQFLLIRTQGFSKLMQRIIESCEITTQYMSSRICIGQSWNLALLVLSNMSRIHFIANHLIRKTCDFYNKLFPYLNKLQPYGVRWLTEGYSFPTDLFSWLNIQTVQNQITQENIINNSNSKNNLILTASLSGNIDLGIKIKRESFDEIKIKTSENKHKIDSITDFDSLKAFMKKEDKYRKSSNDKSLTKHVDLLQWKLLQKLVCKFMKKLVVVQSNKKMTVKLICKVKKMLKNNIEN